MAEKFDIAVIGGGIAGLSVAAELAPEAKVVVLEAEDQPGYHATGRSAAIFAHNYGNSLIRSLTAWSEDTYSADGMNVLSPRGLIRIADAEQKATLETLYRDMSVDCDLTWLTAPEVEACLPLLRQGWAACGFANDAAADMDVATIMTTYARRLGAAGGRIMTGFRVTEASRGPAGWTVCSEKGEQCHAAVLVNAAGAWADHLAELAGVAPIGLVPKRRSAVAFDGPADVETRQMPMAVNAEESLYLKPEGAGLMASPCDQTPVHPADSRPEDIDIAICIDRVERIFDLEVGRPKATWSGLRSFVPDGDPVCGWDTDAPGFFWLAGQGGSGVQTAPALARIAADILLGRDSAARISMAHVDPGYLAPDRLKAKNISTGNREN